MIKFLKDSHRLLNKSEAAVTFHPKPHKNSALQFLQISPMAAATNKRPSKLEFYTPIIINLPSTFFFRYYF